jgi:hypothetical protein
MTQTKLFELQKTSEANAAEIVLYALGEFQARGKVLAERELALDRLRGALRRAAEAFNVEELNDDEIAAQLAALGARVTRRPSYFAKHPFRVLVSDDLAQRAREFYERRTLGRNSET